MSIQVKYLSVHQKQYQGKLNSVMYLTIACGTNKYVLKFEPN